MSSSMNDLRLAAKWLLIWLATGPPVFFLASQASNWRMFNIGMFGLLVVIISWLLGTTMLYVTIGKRLILRLTQRRAKAMDLIFLILIAIYVPGWSSFGIWTYISKSDFYYPGIVQDTIRNVDSWFYFFTLLFGGWIVLAIKDFIFTYPALYIYAKLVSKLFKKSSAEGA